MTPEEITKLAEEYGVDKANCISFSAYKDANIKHVLTSKRFANEAMQVLTWLSEHYCIVEKCKAETAEEVTIDGWVARDRLNNALFLHDEKPYRSFSGYQTDGKEDEWRSDTCPPYPIDYDSFPSLTWESDPLEVTITITTKNKQWKQ